MSLPDTSNLQDAKIDSLQTQYEYLKLLRVRHQHWMGSTNDPRVQRMHREIAALIEQITDQYTHLLDTPR